MKKKKKKARKRNQMKNKVIKETWPPAQIMEELDLKDTNATTAKTQ